MSSVSAIKPAAHGRRGLTLLELLIAIAIAAVFFGGAALAFVQIMHSNDRARARLEALANARHAIDQLSVDLKLARPGPPPDDLFRSQTAAGSYSGNLRDDDADNAVDEEVFDGADTDGDWVLAEHDRHVAIAPGVVERQPLAGIPDPGDANVHEDLAYGLTELVFRAHPDTPTGPSREVRYYVTDYDDEENVLVREVVDIPTNPGDPVTSSLAPVAFNVLSFCALYYDADAAGWTPTWDADLRIAPATTLPVSAYLSVTVHADTLPLSALPAGAELETVTLTTMVNIESVLASAQYDGLRPTYP